MKLSFEDFQKVVNHVAGYLKTRVSRVFDNDGNYVAFIDECDAFDRTMVTGRASADYVTFCYGAGHKRVFNVGNVLKAVN